MAAFKCANDALDYALALQGNTGHLQVQIRAGIHIGPMHVEEGDVFGGTVNFAARVIGAIRGAEIWLSQRAKEDIDRLGAAKYKQLKWERHGGEGVAALGGGGARDVAGRGDERPAAAGPDSAVRLSGATGVAAAGGSAPGRQPATAHVQPRLTHDNLLLHMQHEIGQRNRVAVGKVLRTMECSYGSLLSSSYPAYSSYGA